MPDDLSPDLVLAIEQQVASPQTKYVTATYERLLKAGHSPEDAKSMMAECLADAMEHMLRSRKPFDETAYRSDLELLG